MGPQQQKYQQLGGGRCPSTHLLIILGLPVHPQLVTPLPHDPRPPPFLSPRWLASWLIHKALTGHLLCARHQDTRMNWTQVLSSGSRISLGVGGRWVPMTVRCQVLCR